MKTGKVTTMNHNLVSHDEHRPWRGKGALQKLLEVVIITFRRRFSQNIPRYPHYTTLCGLAVAAKGKPASRKGHTKKKDGYGLKLVETDGGVVDCSNSEWTPTSVDLLAN
jgi:hypothetical protein